MNTLDIINVPLKEGISLIEASAGTGKTFSIANLYLRLLLEKKFQLKSILVVTFTDAAVEELKTRIRDNINDALNYAETGVISEDKQILRDIVDKYSSENPSAVQDLLRSAIVHFDEAAIFTIHSFCKRTLQENSFESMSLFHFELITDQDDFVRETVNDFWRERMVFADPLFEAAAQKNKLGISELLKFSRNVLNRARVSFMPESVDFSEEDFLSLYRKAATLWDRAKAEIIALVNDRVAVKDLSTKARISEHEEKMLLSGFPTEDKLRLLGKLSRSALQSALLKKAKAPVPEHEFFSLCEDFTALEKKFAVYLKISFAGYLKKELKNKKQIKNVQSFDDLLNDLLDTLENPDATTLVNSVSSKFKAVMIDEFQDTDPVQYEIFKKLFFTGRTVLFFIGDPKQSIYEFRGADIFSYINASNDTPSENSFTLAVNWRSESGMVAAVNSVFGNSRNPFVIENVSYMPSDASESSKGNKNPLSVDGESLANLVIFPILDAERDDTAALSKEIAEKKAMDFTANETARLLKLATEGKAFLGERPLMPSDIAILVINHQQSKDMKAKLDELLIPAVIQKSGSVFDSEEALELRKFMAAVETPKNTALVNAALTGAIIGNNGNALRNFLEDEEMFQEYEKHLENFTRYNELWSSKNFIAMFRQFMLDYEVKTRLIQFQDGDRKLTNILHLAELIHRHEAEGETGINGTFSWYCSKLNDPGSEEEHEQRLEKDEKAVQIMTVFKSKGLEYPLVFCPFMWHKTASLNKITEAVYHNENGKACFNLLDYDSLPDKEIAEAIFRENLSSFMRLFYVALTRSKNRCYISAGKIGQNNTVNLFDYLLADGSGNVSDETRNFHNETSQSGMLDIMRNRFSIDENIIVKDGITEAPEIAFSIAAEGNGMDFTQRKFSSRISSGKSITSFSNLISSAEHKSETAVENDESTETVSEAEEIRPEDVAGTFFAFPAGPGPGSCLHRILELADFQLPDFNTLIKDNLALHGIYENDTTKENITYVSSAEIMMRNLFSAPLNDGRKEFSLNQISNENRLNELEFYYTTKQLTAKTLAEVFKTMPGFPEGSKFPEKIGKLDFRPLAGFMHGFMDLVFRHDGKYYIIDWKSNNLGLSYSDYQKDKLLKNMENSFYILQYYIYTCALNKYLKSRIENYNYNEFFGGVFYIYLRGVTPELKGNGIFFDKPDLQAVEALSDLFGILD